MIQVSPALLAELADGYGKRYERLSGIPAAKLARDIVDERKVHAQVAILCSEGRLGPSEALRGKRLLEVGAGVGLFVAVTRRDYGIDAAGVEPAAEGFGGSLATGRRLLAEYGVSPEHLHDAAGESLPFPDASFDLVFSSTVLEHTEDPGRVLDEAVRVLRPGGTLQFVFPNYGSFFEGHYALPWIPYLGQRTGRLWVRLWGRDPSYVDTLRLLNWFWVKRWLGRRSGVELLGLGEEVFRRRLTHLDLPDWAGLARLRPALEVLGRLGLLRLTAWCLAAIKSYDPIILTLRKR